MSAGRITCLLASKISRSRTYAPVRQIYFLASYSHLQSDRDFCNKTPIDSFRTNILANEQNSGFLCMCKRHKSGKKKKQQVEDESDEEWDDEIEGDPDSKVFYAQVSSTRIDLIVKSCLGMARNKAEIALYNSKIRVNGEKVLKKSHQVCVGDVIDLIRGPSPKNPDFLLVSRVTILSASSQEDSIRIKYIRDKSLIIENYEDETNPG